MRFLRSRVKPEMVVDEILDSPANVWDGFWDCSSDGTKTRLFPEWYRNPEKIDSSTASKNRYPNVTCGTPSNLWQLWTWTTNVTFKLKTNLINEQPKFLLGKLWGEVLLLTEHVKHATIFIVSCLLGGWCVPCVTSPFSSSQVQMIIKRLRDERQVKHPIWNQASPVIS